MTVSHRSSIILIITFFVVTLSAARVTAEDEPFFDLWDTSQGLPQNSVPSIVRTPDGYIWFTTFDGLVRFDGVRFKVFKKSNTPELRTNRLLLVMLDKEERLWILTEDRKTLIKYESGRFESFTPGVDFECDDILEPFVESDSMHFRAKGFTYVFQGGKFRKQDQDACPERKVWFSEKYGELIVNGKPYQVDDSDKTAPLLIPKKVAESNHRDRSTVITVELPSGTWFLCPSGQGRFICRLSGSKITVTGTLLTYRADLERDRSGNLWLSDVDGTLDRIPPEAQDTLTLGSKPSDFAVDSPTGANTQILGLFRDSEDHLWIGTSKGLLFLKAAPLVKVLSKRSGLPEENVYAITEDRDGAIWFGAWGRHLVRYLNGQFDLFDLAIVTALYVDTKGQIWSGSSSGLEYFSDGDWKTAFEGRVSDVTFAITAIIEDREGAMWIGSKSGVLRYSAGEITEFKTSNGMPSNDVTSLLETGSGEIWVGTSSGLAKIEKNGIKAFSEKDGMSSSFVRALYEDDDGTLWIGTYDSGLIRYKDGRFANVRSSNGLFGDGVFCILEDNGWFWISNNQGIYRVRRDELNKFADGQISSVFSASYGREDGLTIVEANGGKQPAGIKSSDGKLYFATAGGVAIIDPREAYGRRKPPGARIEEVAIGAEDPVEVGDEIIVKPGQNPLEINYTAFDYDNAKRIQFRYKLDGLDKEWTNAKDRRTAYFSYLPYGEYTFRVAAANRNGEWDETGASIKVIVLRPFYRTSWFYSLAILAGIGILVFIYIYRVRQLQALNHARANFTKRLIETQESERQRIARELHDSIGQSLVVIRNRALMGLRKANDPAGVLDQMEEISEASAAALQETREIAHNLHPYQIRHLGLPMALNTLIDDFEAASGIGFTRNVAEIEGGISEDAAVTVYRIAQECLNNIVRHSKASKVDFRLEAGDGSLVLQIEDNGVGFDTELRTTGLGLQGLKERAEMLGGSVVWKSAPGKGTTVKLKVPFLGSYDEE